MKTFLSLSERMCFTNAHPDLHAGKELPPAFPMSPKQKRSLPNENDSEEEESALEEVRDVVEDGPTLDVVAVRLNLVVVHPVEEEGKRLQVDQGGHDPVDAENLSESWDYTIEIFKNVGKMKAPKLHTFR